MLDSFLKYFDLMAIFKIAMVDITVGLDNAIIIALACAGLAPNQRKLGIFLGTGGAVLLRIVLLAVAAMLMSLHWTLLAAAAAYIVYVGIKLIVHEDEATVDQKDNLKDAVITIIIADFMMSLDNVLAVTTAAASSPHPLLYAVFGVILSIPIIVFASKGLIALIEKAPIIKWIGAAALGYVGAEMFTNIAMFNQTFVTNSVLGISLKTLFEVSGAIFVIVVAKLLRKS